MQSPGIVIYSNAHLAIATAGGFNKCASQIWGFDIIFIMTTLDYRDLLANITIYLI